MANDLSAQVIAQVSERLGQCVYMLVDPRDARPFYVGKGRGVRMLAHGLEARNDVVEDDGTKVARIREIRSAGLEHQIWIARYGLSNAEYTAVEAASIDVLTSFPVTPAADGSTRRPLALRGELTNARREDAREGPHPPRPPGRRARRPDPRHEPAPCVDHAQPMARPEGGNRRRAGPARSGLQTRME